MTRDEKIAALQAKADELLQWFERRELPVAPFKLKPWITVLDCAKMLETNKLRMNAHRSNPFNRQYVNGYFTLNDLKQYIEQNANRTTDSNASTVPPVN